VLCQVCVLSAGSKSLDTVTNQIVSTETTESLEVLFEVGLRGLASVADGHSVVLVVVARGASLEQVSPSFINCANKHTNSEGSLCGVRSLNLTLFGNFDDETLGRMLTLMGVPVVEALIAHKFAQETSIGSHTGDHDTHVAVDVKHFLLVRRQVMNAFLQTDDHLSTKTKV